MKPPDSEPETERFNIAPVWTSLDAIEPFSAGKSPADSATGAMHGAATQDHERPSANHPPVRHPGPPPLVPAIPSMPLACSSSDAIIYARAPLQRLMALTELAPSTIKKQ